MIPLIKVEARGLAEAYENALLKLYHHGMEIPTDYDKEGDRKSRDCTMIILVKEPLAEPMIHRCFPGGLEDLEEYRQEVLDGIKDEFVRDLNDPDDKRWLYTYHQRLCNQFQRVLAELVRNPFTRRANMTTWLADSDIESEDPPCLQRIWLRCTQQGGVKYLNMHVSMRSNDAFKASFMNMFAFIMLQQRFASQLSESLKEPVKVGQYLHMADSFHIYGCDLQQFEQLFMKSLKNRSFEERTYTYEFCKPFFEEAKAKIKKKIASMRAEI